MNDILTDTAKSFRLMRPKTQSGTFKPMSTYTKKRDNILFLPIVDEKEDIAKALTTLLGPVGIKKSFFNYFFLKRYIWRSVLYPKPVVREYIDSKEREQFAKSRLQLSGRIGNRIFNRKNLVIDYTDIFKLLVPEDRTIMMKPSVINYLQNIYPELICYILFSNPKHDKKNDIEESEEDLGDRPDFETKTIPSGFSYIDNPDDKLKEPFVEMTDEEFENLKAEMEMSDEAFNEYLTKETKTFAMGGQGLGLSAYGFDKFIVSFNYKLTTKKYLTKAFMFQKVPLPRNVKLDPTLIYQITFIQFIYEAYCYYYGEPLKSSTSEYIAEICKHNVTFHIYGDTGLGFCLNFNEIKNGLKYNPMRFYAMLVLRLNLISMCNTGVVTESDLDKLDDADIEKEFSKLTSSVTSDTKDILKSGLKEDVKSVLDSDLAIRTLIKSKTSDEIVASNKPSEEVPENKSHLIITPENVAESKTAMAELTKLTNIFGKPSSASKEPEIDDEGTTELSDADINDMFDAADEFDEEELDGDEYDDEEEINEEEEQLESDNVVEEALDEMENDPVGVGNSNEIASDNDFEDEIDLMEYEFNEPDNEVVEEYEDDDVEILKAKTIKNVDVNYIDPNKRMSNLSAADIKRIEILKDKYKSLKIDGKAVTDIIGNAKKINIESSVDFGSKKPRTKDPNVTKLNAIDFQKSYVKNNYQPDIINAVRSLSVNKDVPLYITNIKVDDTSDQFNDRLTYHFTLEDQFKKKHELKFNVPKLDENGFMKIQGRTKYLKNQLIRKPVVKIGSDKVYITTQLNSYQVMRNGYTLNKVSEVVRRLVTEYFVDNPNIRIERGDCSKNNVDYITTIEYDILADKYFYFNINDGSEYGEHVIVYFDQSVIREKIKEHNINTGFKDNVLPPYILPIAINYTTKSLYSIDVRKDGSVSSTIIMILQNTLNDPGISEFVEKVKVPKRRICSMIEIQSKKVPLISLLGYLFGWDRVISYFPENEIEFSEKRKVNTNKLCVRFANGFLYYNQYPINGTILLNGLTQMSTEQYNYEDLNNPGLYIDFTQEKYGTRNIVKGWVTARESMLDMKTLQILEELGLPTDLCELFLYCNDLLVDNQVKSESDITNYRIRSNEIISQCLYQVLNDQYTTFKKRSGKKVTMTIPIDSVMSKVYSTEILENYDCLNPVAEIRNMGLTTFKGPGGTKMEQAFTTKKRAYDPSYFGTFGVSTPDNSNAGIVKELTLNPKIANTLGFIEPQDKNNFSLNDIGTIAEALTPFVNTKDDPSRIAFVSGQNNHVGGLLGSSLPCVRTGVERTIQYQCGENFVKCAKQDGTITQVDEVGKKVYITYKDGSKEVLDFNNMLLKNSDAFNEAVYNCFVKEGAKVKAGDVIVADKRFFKVDPITGELIYTQTANAMVAIMEGAYTEDDADLITQEFSEKLTMNFTKCKQISITNANEATIIDYKKVGDHVMLGDPIFVFDDTGALNDSTSDDAEEDILNDLFQGIDSNVLAGMIHKTPKANLTGVIKDMKVYWTCPIDKMSPTVAKFVNEYIKTHKREIIDEEKFTGKTSEKRKTIEVTTVNKDKTDPRINGALVGLEGIVIEYYIGHEDQMGTGDKIALNSSLKTINSTVVPKGKEPYTESGNKLDGIFSWISINARMIKSIWYQFLGTILYKFTKKTARDFLKEIGEDIPESKRKVKLNK